jgi:phospholipid/cholesterol/gamma-HCH transport system substrate-binding protein
MRRRRTSVVALVAAGVMLLSGCGFNVFSLPLPGGAKIKGPSYVVTAEFKDVLDLVPKSSVKVNDVTVGRVEKVWLDGYVAKVRMRLPKSVALPDNARATIRQTSLLGEKFVSLAPPTADLDGEEPQGTLGNGELIPLAHTTSSVEVEDVFSALSLLLNGGGVAQLKIITDELNKALSGNEPAIRSVLGQLNAFIGTLDAGKNTIVDAIVALDNLAKKLNAQKATLATAIDSLPGSLKVLDQQRSALVRTLQALSKLGATGVRVINATQADTIANLRSLNPILTELIRAGRDLPNAMELVFTYPFPDSAARAVKGDYTNLDVTLDVDTEQVLKQIPGLQALPKPPALPKVPVPTVTIPKPPGIPNPTVPSLPSVPVPTGAGPTTCVTVLGQPVCNPLNRAGLDPALAEMMMPGVRG